MFVWVNKSQWVVPESGLFTHSAFKGAISQLSELCKLCFNIFASPYMVSLFSATFDYGCLYQSYSEAGVATRRQRIGAWDNSHFGMEGYDTMVSILHKITNSSLHFRHTSDVCEKSHNSVLYIGVWLCQTYLLVQILNVWLFNYEARCVTYYFVLCNSLGLFRMTWYIDRFKILLLW